MLVEDINDRGQIVGWVRRFDPPEDQPFLGQKGVMIDLEAAIVPGTTVTDVTRALAINESGQIVLWGTSLAHSGSALTILLTPIARDGDVDGDCIVNADDVMFLIEDWGQARSPADLDGDGIVGIRDRLTVRANWGG